MDEVSVCRTCREQVSKNYAETREYRRTKLCRFCLHDQATELLKRATRPLHDRTMDDRTVQELYDDGVL